MRLMLICLAAIILAGCDKPVHEAQLRTGNLATMLVANPRA